MGKTGSNATKKLVYKHKDIRYSLEGPIGRVIDNLKLLQEENKDYDISLGIGYSYGDKYVEAQVSWQELETDEEFKKRLENEKKVTAARRAYFETLKKEFGE